METNLETLNDYMINSILNNQITLSITKKGFGTAQNGEFKKYQDKNIPIVLNVYNRVFANFISEDDTDIELIKKYLKKTNLKLKKRNKQYYIINK